MPQHLQILINLLTKNDIKALLQHYVNSSEAENVDQLGFMFKQAQIKSSPYDFYQQLAIGFIEKKGFPTTLINKIKTHSTLSFFTPALQLETNFKQTDSKQCNVLHYLFTNEQLVSANNQPPFNYLRSMMLFGSNEALRDSLCQRDKQNLTPIEAYLFTNKNFTPLANHELTALLALIEIESKQQQIEQTHYSLFIKTLSQLFKKQNQTINSEIQRVMLIATYYSITIERVINDTVTD